MPTDRNLLMPTETIETEEVAKILRCSEAEVEQLARDGDIPGLKFGRGWIFVRHDLIAYIAEEARNQAKQRREKKAPAPAGGKMSTPPQSQRARRTPPALPAPALPQLQ